MHSAIEFHRVVSMDILGRVWLRCLLAFLLVLTSSMGQIGPVYYCIDDEVLRIFANRLSCLRHNSVAEELMLLRSESAAEYSRAHELIAYEYFVNTRNPLRKACSDASVTTEYIPILPLSWRQHANISAPCDYSTLIKNIIEYVNYRKTTSYRYLYINQLNFKILLIS